MANSNNKVIYGDNRSIGNTLSAFLYKDDTLSKKIERTVGYDHSLFINQNEASKYLCTICQHVILDCVDIGCGNNHFYCEKCLDIYYEINYGVHDNNLIIYNPNVQNNAFNIKSLTCPCCKKPVKKLMKVKSPAIDKLINELFVQCPLYSSNDVNGDNACKWIGKLKKLNKHQSFNCVNIMQKK